jgi:hypothetical protein
VIFELWCNYVSHTCEQYIRKETVLAYFKKLHTDLPSGTEKEHKKLNQDSQSPGRDFNTGPPEYEARVLITQPRHLVKSTTMFLQSSIIGLLTFQPRCFLHSFCTPSLSFTDISMLCTYDRRRVPFIWWSGPPFVSNNRYCLQEWSHSRNTQRTTNFCSQIRVSIVGSYTVM